MRELRAAAHAHKCFCGASYIASYTVRAYVASQWISQLLVVPGRPEEKSTGSDVYRLFFTHRRRRKHAIP